MLRVLIFFGFVLALAFGFAWLADRPGTVAIDWLGYEVELSAMIAMVGLFVLVVAVMATWWVLKAIIRSPQMVGGYFSARRRDKGYEALSSGLVAAGSGDGRAAQRYAQQAQKLMPDAPLTRVLTASSADLNDDDGAKRLAYRQMLDDPKTQLLGLRGLYLDAVTEDDEDAARHFADQAAALAPALPWAGQAQFEDQVQRGDWPAARAALERNVGARIVSKAQRNRLRAVLLTADAIDREQGEPEVAKPMALEAHKLAPDLVPAAAIAGRLLIRANKMTQASKVIETAWRKAPHPELAEVYLYVRPGDAVADRVKRARKLAQLCAHALEGELALARALVEAGDLEGARKALDPFTGPEATQRVCLLMAEIEEKEGGDTGAVRGWMARALRAKRDPAWMADGYISSTWEPVSPLSGKVDAFAWKVPVERFTAHDPVMIPDNAMGEDGSVVMPARLPMVIATSTSRPAQPALPAHTEVPVAEADDAELVLEDDNEAQADSDSSVGQDREGKASSKRAEPEVPSPVVANDDAKPAPMVDGKTAELADSKAKPDPKPVAAKADVSEQTVNYSGLPDGKAPDDPGPNGTSDDPDPADRADGGDRKRFRLF